MVLKSLANVFYHNTRITTHSGDDGVGVGTGESSRRKKQQQKQLLFQKQQQQQQQQQEQQLKEGPLRTKSSSIVWKSKKASTKEEKLRIPSEISITFTSSTDCDTCTGSHCSSRSRSRTRRQSSQHCQHQQAEEYDMLEAYHSSTTTTTTTTTTATTTRTSSWDVCSANSSNTGTHRHSNEYPIQVEFTMNDDFDSYYGDFDENNNHDEYDDEDDCSYGQDEGLLLCCCQLLNQDSKHTSLGFSPTCNEVTKSQKSILVSTNNTCTKHTKAIKKTVSFANSAQVHAYEIQTVTIDDTDTNYEQNTTSTNTIEQLYYTKKQRIVLEKQLKRQINLLRTVPNSMIGYTPDEFIATIRGIECMLDSQVQDEIVLRQKLILQHVLLVQQQYKYKQSPFNEIDTNTKLTELLRETSLKISYKAKELALDLADYSTALEMLSQKNM